ncbi:type II secretion system protein GspE [Atlantibacter hermannii]|uniref:type II secretion system protein GspE n=1 Tax=Atlantibacter hermannii TaxID=565 RepID=UPI0022B7A03C|nr:type II secretion system protein GspE [Atlantibacter hermannii]MCZ7832845.1 type II secretion system protein GspE [Atlantibacter hermannii]
MDREFLLALCKRHHAHLVDLTDAEVRIALSGTPGKELLDALHFATQRQVNIEYWSAEQLEKHQQQTQPAQPDDSTSAVAWLDETLLHALKRRASDIHIEPGDNHWRVRLRVDGVLHPFTTLPAELAQAVMARLKVLGELDIAERRLPQDGQFSVPLQGKPVSFRLSTLPCRSGEKAVLRLLEQNDRPLAVESLGMLPVQQADFYRAISAPQGLILVTGPTGSGKTITLYSALGALNSPELNLCSVEDPIEIPLSGLNQTQVNTKAGLNFQNVLRALLRQDPDVVMVGEIRDGETAEIAIKAAQTGHLVLSTLHTNSTVETLTRLEQMGIARWMLASALEIIIAQRLVRRLCPHCRVRLTQPAALPAAFWSSPLYAWEAKGCAQCYSGFYGRVALFEVLTLEPGLRQAIVDGASAQQVEQQAHELGMVTLFEHGLKAVEQGLTTLQEVYRVLGMPHE